MRYFVFFSYDGTAYHGWQIQPNAHSVQAEMQRALSLLLGSDAELVGAGRTDTGVHARVMAAHFDAAPIDCAELARRLNRVLPADIEVDRIVPVSDDAHARFSALSRTYHYFVRRRKLPFRRHYAALFAFPLDIDRMNAAAAVLLGTHDFASFCKVGGNSKTTLCRVDAAAWTEVEPDLWRFEIKADRFLRNMVRAIVGTLIDVGRGKISVDDFADIIQSRDRCAAGESAPANGLFLVDVAYPENIFL